MDVNADLLLPLGSFSREMGTTPEAFMEQLLPSTPFREFQFHLSQTQTEHTQHPTLLLPLGSFCA